MSGDVTARRKKKNAKKSTEDDLKSNMATLKEPENPRIRLVPRKARDVKVEVEEEKRSFLGRLCYASIILLLLSSSICGVYMLVYGVDPTDMSSLQKFDVAESLERIGEGLRKIELPHFELGAESILPNFLGSELSMPSRESLDSMSASLAANLQSSWTSVVGTASSVWSSLSSISATKQLSLACRGLVSMFEAVENQLESLADTTFTSMGRHYDCLLALFSTYTTTVLEATEQIIAKEPNNVDSLKEAKDELTGAYEKPVAYSTEEEEPIDQRETELVFEEETPIVTIEKPSEAMEVVTTKSAEPTKADKEPMSSYTNVPVNVKPEK